jgi:hypothetical protein
MNSTALTPSATVTLTALDRCDRCSARAKMQVVLPSGGELLFCAHHGRAHWSALTRQGAEFRAATED